MPKEPNQIAAKNIRACRLALSWSQEQLAEQAGLHRTYVGAIERGERNITLNTLAAIATALKVSSKQLLSKR